MGTSTPLFKAALLYLGRGWTIIPTQGKEPPARMPWKMYQATRPDEAMLRRLFCRQGLTGLAGLLGSASGGLACRDFDVADSYRRWAAAHADLAAALPTVTTARGYHVYCRSPKEYFADLGDGEFRAGAKHYVLLPPSRHPDGPFYHWLIPLPAAPLPTLDPVQAGLLPSGETERTERTESDREDR